VCVLFMHIHNKQVKPYYTRALEHSRSLSAKPDTTYAYCYGNVCDDINADDTDNHGDSHKRYPD